MRTNIGGVAKRGGLMSFAQRNQIRFLGATGLLLAFLFLQRGRNIELPDPKNQPGLEVLPGRTTRHYGKVIGYRN